MKVLTKVTYTHTVIAPKGFVFDETKIDKIGTSVFGETVTLSRKNTVLRFSENHINTMPQNERLDWDAFMDKHLSQYLIPQTA